MKTLLLIFVIIYHGLRANKKRNSNKQSCRVTDDCPASFRNSHARETHLQDAPLKIAGKIMTTRKAGGLLLGYNPW
ncbi:MAG: hypothetical protein ACI4B9_03530, partial [Eggerthellaceae bacterium]